jgi:hypothetical protein
MHLVLIDGADLTRLIVEYNIGVSGRETFELKVIDQERGWSRIWRALVASAQSTKANPE